MNPTDKPKPVDLLAIITRLHTKRGAADDEFVREWCLPKKNLGRAGILYGKKKVTGFWVWSENTNEGLVVLHGCDDCLVGDKGAFQKSVLDALTCSGFASKKFARLAVFAHGRIPETNAELMMEGERRPECSQLEEKFDGPLLLGNYSLGDGPAALAIPSMLREEALPLTLIEMVQSQLKIEPAVDLAVRSMQYIVLEMRLWWDIHLKAKDGGHDIRDKFQDCWTRINNADHWSSKAIKKVRFYETLIEFLSEPLETLVKDLFERSFDCDNIAAMAETLGGAEYLKYDAELLNCIRDERLPDRENADAAKVDQSFRTLAARLELLIEAAREKDKQREVAL